MVLKKYTKKPVEVEAVKFTEENKDQVFNEITCNSYPEFDENKKPYIKIQTLEGEMNLTLGNYLIKGVKGEFYPCRADIFEETYSESDNYDAKEHESFYP